MTDGPDDGVLGNLPRSRPGTRSAKREAPKQRPARRKPAAARPEPVRSVGRAEQREPQPEPTSDVVDLSMRAAEAWAGIVLFWPRVAVHVTAAVLRRLPRLF